MGITNFLEFFEISIYITIPVPCLFLQNKTKRAYFRENPKVADTNASNLGN